MTIPLLDLQAQFAGIREEVHRELARVIESQRFILGEEVDLFEREIAAYCGVKHAIGCASGSDALLLALVAHGIGARPGDEVLTVPFSFFATAGEIVHAGARPIFTDIEAGTFNIDVERAAATLRDHPKIGAIVPVHLFGGCADMDPILALGEAHGIPVIEDAAQAIGAEYRGRRAGSMGHAACFSFFPSKNLGAFGDGGLITTNDAALADRLRAWRAHGSREKYHHEFVGYNSRLDALQAAVLRIKLRRLDLWTAGRGRNAESYHRLFAAASTPVIPPLPAVYQTRHIWNQFVIRAQRRDELRHCLTEHGVGTEIYYPEPLHLQPCFAYLGYQPGDFPVAEKTAREALALPIYAELAQEDLERVVRLINSFYSI
jgi:dTDP-4-amino-4,6-dideoxygalactose transaminase